MAELSKLPIFQNIRDAIDGVLPRQLAHAFETIDTPTFLGLFFTVLALIVANGYLMIKGTDDTLPALNQQWQKFNLIKKIEISSNTSVYRFALPTPKHYLGLPIGQHIQIQAKINDKMVSRSYTPISSDDDLGHFELMVKTYPEGNISQYLHKLKLGDAVEFKGPKGQMKYSEKYAKHVGMLAGGTGITPMLQIIRAALKNPKDKTRVSLIYANVTEKDILLRKDLDRIADESQGQFDVHYVLDKPPEGWKGATGYISKDLIEQYMPKPAKENHVLLCGPPPMVKALKKSLEELKYEPANLISKLPDQVFCF